MSRLKDLAKLEKRAEKVLDELRKLRREMQREENMLKIIEQVTMEFGGWHVEYKPVVDVLASLDRGHSISMGELTRKCGLSSDGVVKIVLGALVEPKQRRPLFREKRYVYEENGNDSEELKPEDWDAETKRFYHPITGEVVDSKMIVSVYERL